MLPCNVMSVTSEFSLKYLSLVTEVVEIKIEITRYPTSFGSL